MKNSTLTSNGDHEVQKSGYEVPYWWYDIRGFFIFKMSYQDSLLRTVHAFAKNLTEEHLEVAVGSGSFLDLCLMWGRLIGKKGKGVAFDYMPDMLKGAKTKFGKSHKWQIEAQDVTKLPYENESFQSINTANAFHCFSDPQTASNELFRVLKPGGSMVVNIVTPPRGFGWQKRIAQRQVEWGKRTRILHDVIDKIDAEAIFAESGFSIDEAQWRGNNLIVKLGKPQEVSL